MTHYTNHNNVNHCQTITINTKYDKNQIQYLKLITLISNNFTGYRKKSVPNKVLHQYTSQFAVQVVVSIV